MKFIIIFTLFILLFSSFLFSQEERKVLVEIFTNSHCPLCPAAHNVLENYLVGPNGNKISYIFYHMVYPYADDSLYHQSMESSDTRNNYYNPVPATPQGWFDGVHQGSTSGWAASLDNFVSTQSPLKIILSGTRNSTHFNVNAQLTNTGNIPDNDLVIHFVVVENLYYTGRNGISNHKHAMRKMFPAPGGQSFSIDLNETKDIPQTFTLDPLWNDDSLSVVVFVQSTGSMTIYQSETINYNDIVVSVNDGKENIPDKFILKQNYLNPFNPTTTIQFQVPNESFVNIIVYDILGKEVASLVNEKMPAGSYEVNFDASGLSSGIYFYKLQTDAFVETKKMILMK